MTTGALLSGQWPGGTAPDDMVRALLPRLADAGRAVKGRLVQGLGAAASPVTIGTQAAGSFDDATGHSGQSHLVYAVNSRVWWLFTLTSAADSNGGSNHIVKAYVSSGPDLTKATWIAAGDSPGAASGSPNGSLTGGRSLGVAYLNNSPVDVIHADISMAFDGQNGRTAHIRAVVNGTSIAWGAWNNFDEPAATWTEPHGNVVGVSSGKFIHTGGPILQQEVDANARKSANADTGSAWTSGFANPSVIDGTMVNQSNSMVFAPLANNVMLAVYDNGLGNEPNQNNLRFKRSNAGGAWPNIVVGSQTGGDGSVFATNASIDQNDWGLVGVNVNQIYAFRRKAGGAGIDAAAYNVAGNSWAAMSPAPPAFGTGQAVKAGGGVFTATDGLNVFVCVINTDSANSILCSRFDGTVWGTWAAVPGTDVGIQTRRYLSGSPQVGNGQVGLIWTEGASFFDIVTTSFIGAPDVTAPAVALTAPLDKAAVSGVISLTASASDNVGVAGVQFRLDGVSLGVEATSAPYTILWNTATAANGAHTLTAVARDDAGNATTAAAVSVTVTNAQTPIITWPAPQRIVLGTPLGPLQLNASANTDGTFAYTPPLDTVLPAGAGQKLSTVFTPTDTVLFTTATASVNIDVVMVVPNVVGLTRAAASSAIVAAGLTVGTVTQASSLTVPSGAVISQTPSAASESATVVAVDLVVSTGAVTVPNLVGLTQAAATTALTDAGLTLGAISTASSTTVPSGSVISQNPAFGAQVLGASAVALVVSSGPPKVAAPNAVGLTQAAASTAITNAGLIVGTVTTQSSTTVPSGTVISQNPTAGTQVVVGSAVNLVVSSGPPQVAVPNVVGLTQAAATT
ncbi:MAG TPA: PASTA domain-containing protein, partial [Vicinamibacterales bacterium]|nr:PASTA domain-containing protein [Vicinamibacterales bacterium]